MCSVLNCTTYYYSIYTQAGLLWLWLILLGYITLLVGLLKIYIYICNYVPVGGTLNTYCYNSDLWLEQLQDITHIHLDPKQTVDFHTVIHKKKISTLWDAGTIKSVISRACFKKLGNPEKLHACTSIRLLSASGNKLESLDKVTLEIKLNTFQVKCTL